MLISGNEAQMTYKVNQIRTASKDQLLLMIYDIGISATKIAKNAVKDENNEMANKELQRAQAALRELMNALDVSAGEWANTLMSLYEFMHEQLVKANVSKDPDLIESVKLMLEELRAVWQEAIEKSRVESFAQEEMDHGEVRPQGVLILQVNVDNIKGLAEKEQKLYRDLISLVDEEMEHARAGNTMALMDVLKRKQAVISCQEALQDKWLEFAASMGISSSRETVEFWDALAARLGKEGSKDVIEKIIEIRKMAAEILEKEYEVQKELESHLAKLRSNLLKLNDGMRAFKAYMS